MPGKAPTKFEGPLSGLRVVELEGLGPVPLAGMLMADMGADVVRISRPNGTPAGTEFPTLDRGRQVVRADLKDPGDLERARALIGASEVLIEGFRPGVLEKLGLGPDALHQANPALVIGRMTGWGQDGPLSASAGHDINYISVTGALSAIGPRDRPAVPLNLVGDYGGGALFLAMGVLAAVMRARATGQGEIIDAAMCDGVLSLMAIFFDFAARGKYTECRESNMLDGGAPFYGVYECADGKFISLGALEPQFYNVFCALVDDLELSEYRQYDRSSWPALRTCLTRIFLGKTQTEWARIFEGSDACVAPVLGLSEAGEHPQLAARGSVLRLDNMNQPAPAPRFTKAPSRARPVQNVSMETVLERWAR